MKIFGFNITKDTKPKTKRMAKGRYKIVDGFSQHMIEPSNTEFRTEDEILD